MAKVKKEKTAKQKLWDKRKEYHNTLSDEKRNPNHKEDFENALAKIFPPIKPKAVKMKITKKKTKQKRA